ncbi:toll/interleukin-1 receptor domain-containing protein [Pseudomonas sp. LS2P72]
MTIPKVFVSYSHDSQEHKKWVLEFATRLRNSGVDAALDQWDLKPGDDLPHFMEQNLASSDRVIMVCTERYVDKANIGSGGVGYEKMIVTSDLMKSINSNKVIPVIRQAGTFIVPTFLKSKMFIDFSDDGQSEFSYDELIRSLHGSPLFVKPPVGNSPFLPVVDNMPERTGDAILELMKTIVDVFERQTHDYLDYGTVLRKMGISRLMFDVLIDQALEADYITQYGDKDLSLTGKGKQYAMFHKLVG